MNTRQYPQGARWRGQHPLPPLIGNDVDVKENQHARTEPFSPRGGGGFNFSQPGQPGQREEVKQPVDDEIVFDDVIDDTR
jgi:hypothetical protein